MMDNPRGANYTGGTTSAPVFRAIAERIMSVTDLLAPSSPMATAGEILNEHQPETVKKQKQEVKKNIRSVPVVPELRGMSLRRAMSILAEKKLVAIVSGSGTVVSQQPAAGQRVQKGMKVRLVCQPKLSSTVGVNRFTGEFGR
jgi:cell division protein FtsI (penicillin-binding protein 3)